MEDDNGRKLHFVAGFGIGLTLRFLPRAAAERKINELDIFGWNRELRQHPGDDVLTPHQIAEARAWGEGARRSRGLNPPFPSPPYPA